MWSDPSRARPAPPGGDGARPYAAAVTDAPAPEVLANLGERVPASGDPEEIIDAFMAHFEVTVETVTTAEESITFKLPRELREMPAL